MAKKFYASKMVLFNAAAVIVFVIPLLLEPFGYTGDIAPDVLNYIQIFVPAVVALINIILRFVTKEPIEL